MANNDLQTTYNFEAKLVAVSYIADFYQSEVIDLGLFSKETFAIDAAVLKIKEGIYNLYKIFIEELNDRKENDFFLSGEQIFITESIEVVVKFLKETYNNSFSDNFDVKKVNEIIQNISETLQETENFDVDDYYRRNDSSYFSPFFCVFYDDFSETHEYDAFVLEIKEVVVDKFSSDQELPSSIE